MTANSIVVRRLSGMLLLTSVLINACAPTPTVKPAPVIGPQAIEKAREAEARGDLLLAAREYSQLAASAEPPQRQELQLHAADLLFRGKHIAQAKHYLGRIDTEGLAPSYGARKQLLLAKLALAENDAERALALARSVEPGTPLSPALQAEIHAVRASAYATVGNLLEAARERVTLEPLLPSPQAVQENQHAIWLALSGLSEQALERLRTQPPPDILSGWMELAYIAKAYAQQPAVLNEHIAQWRGRYPGHPAAPTLAQSLLAKIEPPRQYRHIALLLPLRGKFAKQAAAVRDGFLSAYFAHEPSDGRPALHIYDIGGTTAGVEDIQQTYRQAIDDGADFVVGPLDKAAVTVLAQMERLPVPTLVLNYSETSAATENMYQFGLSPEDEARQAAERAWLDGHSQAAAIFPDTPWGHRVFTAFRERWEQFGGILVDLQTYAPDKTDFSTPIRDMLSIDKSEARMRALKARLGRDLKFEPRRRQDVEFVFMLGFPIEARQIRPQLNFHRAAELPVYATSHVYSGKLDKNMDRDMDGILFSDMPWVLGRGSAQQELRTKIMQLWPEFAEQFLRLYALGVDAYNLIPRLTQLHAYRYERVSGETGSLSMDEAGRIQRQLLWARFSSGKPHIVEYAPMPNSDDGAHAQPQSVH